MRDLSAPSPRGAREREAPTRTNLELPLSDNRKSDNKKTNLCLLECRPITLSMYVDGRDRTHTNALHSPTATRRRAAYVLSIEAGSDWLETACMPLRRNFHRVAHMRTERLVRKSIMIVATPRCSLARLRSFALGRYTACQALPRSKRISYCHAARFMHFLQTSCGNTAALSPT